jgi:hypothetical protein
MAQFVVLSMLLHAFFILLFGNPTGGSREGEAMWGSLDVTIRGPLMDEGVGLRLDRGLSPGLPGSGLLERRQQAREAAPPPAPVRPRPPPDMNAPKETDIPSAMSVPATAPVRPAYLEPAPRIERLAPAVPQVAVPTLDWKPRPAIEPTLAPPVELPPADVPEVDVPTIDYAPRPALVPKLAPPVVVPPAQIPEVKAPTLDYAPRPALVPKLAPPVELPPAAIPAARAPATAADLPEVSAPAMAMPAPAAIAPKLAPPVELAPVAPPAAKAPAPEAKPRFERAAPPTGDRGTATPSSRDSPIFDNRGPPASVVPVPGTGPRIDLEAARARARQMAREGTGNRALLPFAMPPVPKPKSREELAIEKAWKPDCKDAYKDLGLLAVIPLVANQFGEGTCRW